MPHLTHWSAWLVPLLYLLGAAAALNRRSVWLALACASGGALGAALAGDLSHLSRAAQFGPHNGAAAAVMTLIAFLGWVIGRYSRGNLAGERGERRFVCALLLTLAAVSAVVAARNFAVLVLAWSASSLALHPLLTHFRERPAARIAARKKFLASRLAEACLLSAAVLLYRRWHTLGLTPLAKLIAAHGAAGAGMQSAAVLLAAAVLLKSAQLPVHGWLVQVMEAPTSVSALMHAGVVNLGGYVLIRLAPLISASLPAQGLLVLVGSTTAALAGLTLMTCPSLKGRLAWSTCSQMGLMATECGLGLYGLALLHLLGHALYKAHAFLCAGEAVRESTAARMRPAPLPRARFAPLLGLAAAGGLVALSAHLWHTALHAPTVPWAALLLCTFGIATLLWEGGADRLTRSRNLLAAALAIQLYLLWHWAMSRGLGVSSAHPAPLLAAYSALCLLMLYGAQGRLWRSGSAARRSRWYAWTAAGYFLDEPLTRLVTSGWPWRNGHTLQGPLSQWRAQREGGTA
ncbi:MAG: NADH-quinone oxidoreductase subunit L [Steroidobacteraceae bacterium]